MKFIFATQNQNKVKEVSKILDNKEAILISLAEIGYTDDIAETGTTLNENAWIKADTIHTTLGGNVIAEDTGLEVTAIDMAPGVYSARYAGPQKNDQDNINKLLDTLKDKEDRSARFRTVVAVWLDGERHTFEGIVNGTIAHERMGTGGFGYDPVFIPEGHDQSFGILSAKIKNSISHRGRAFTAVKEFLAKISES